MDAVLHAIAEPHRREILRLVWTRELTAGDIAANFSLTRPAISQHLRVLKDAGLLDERRDGVKRWYRARPAAIAEVVDELTHFWGDSLERLRIAAEDEMRRTSD